jgi:transposase
MWGPTTATGRKNGDGGDSERSADPAIDIEEARSGEAPPSAAPDPEVREKATRRKFTQGEIKAMLREFEALPRGKQGAYLREKGLYSSYIAKWRGWRDQGKLERPAAKRGPKPKPREVVELEAALNAKDRENRRLTKALGRAELMLELQKKVNEVLGISQKACEVEEND